MYAVVDVETTGGYAENHRITEIGIVHLDMHGKITDRFHSLIDPLQHIPQHITALTGIDNSMTDDAPSFENLADQIREFLADRIFVAHNVHFDFSFIHEEFKRIGQDFQSKRLCTVKISRKVFPDLNRYSLKSLCQNLSIENENPHRALSDAEAAARVLQIAMKKPGSDKILMGMLNRQRGEVKLPMNLDPDQFKELPNSPGVYFFRDEKGKPIYIGKAKNLKQRVSTHFTGDGSTWRSQAFKREIHYIDHILTGTELMAMILEDNEIRKHWPRHNRAQKSPIKRFGLVGYQDQRKNWRIAIRPLRTGEEGIEVYFSYPSALNALYKVCEAFGLDRELCHLPSIGQEPVPVGEHNERLQRWMEELSEPQREVFRLKGPMPENQVLLLVKNGMPIGWGVLDSLSQINDPEEVISSLSPLSPSLTTARIWENHREGSSLEPVFSIK